MFKHLQEIDYKLYERYLTLEKNIKAGSNSFYDAYLDLQEQFVKDIAIFCGLDIKAKETCGGERMIALEILKKLWNRKMFIAFLLAVALLLCHFVHSCRYDSCFDRLWEILDAFR